MAETERITRLLSGGAAAGLVNALAPAFLAETGWQVAGEFSAVGAMAAKLRGGAAADLLILTDSVIDALERDGLVDGGSRRAIGVVHTGIAVRVGDALPAVADGDALRTALMQADAIYLPDPVQSTAGIHVASVLDRLGLATAAAPRLRPFPNGNTAMRELAASVSGRPIGLTQVTEILGTQGVALVGHLPGPYALATTYTGAIARGAKAPDAARRLLELLAGETAQAARQAAGFCEVGPTPA